jgi:hypothetical protein
MEAPPLPPAWTADLPVSEGWYEFFDPVHGIWALVQVRTVAGELAVRAPRCPDWWIPVARWQRPCLRLSRWRGPLPVPDALPEGFGAEVGEEARGASPQAPPPAPGRPPDPAAGPAGFWIGAGLWLALGLALAV